MSSSLQLPLSRKLEPVALHDVVLAEIRRAIVAGSIQPGEIHSARGLARQLGVSQTPVREAMLKLVAEGVLVPVPTRGFQLLELTDAELEELAWTRALLEPPAVEVAARRATAADLQPFGSLIDRMAAAAQSGDYVAFFELDRTFHLDLVRLSGREQLLAVVEQLRDRTLRYGIAATTADEGRGLRRLQDEHRRLLRLVSEQNGAAAAELLYKHILGSRASRFETTRREPSSSA